MTDELTALSEENARLKAELAQMKDRWERELIVAKAALVNAQAEMELIRERLRTAMIRTLEAEDEVFAVRERTAMGND